MKDRALNSHGYAIESRSRNIPKPTQPATELSIEKRVESQEAARRRTANV
jgi:hypothetical protein